MDTYDKLARDYHEDKNCFKVVPKFKVGDWIVSNYNNVTYIESISDTKYNLQCKDGFHEKMSIEYIDRNWHLWSIDDAKDGDVLAYVTDEEDLWIMIYWSLYEPYEGHVHYHALLVNDSFSDKGTCCICINDLKPATKEQRDLLFSKMKEAGYEWDAEKKELKKTEQKSKWSDEDDGMVAGIKSHLRQSLTSEAYTSYRRWLESLKQRMEELTEEKLL